MRERAGGNGLPTPLRLSHLFKSLRSFANSFIALNFNRALQGAHNDN
jgi:hypothetical protein